MKRTLCDRKVEMVQECPKCGKNMKIEKTEEDKWGNEEVYWRCPHCRHEEMEVW